jgi:hypothetical protein
MALLERMADTAEDPDLATFIRSMPFSIGMTEVPEA